jgi:magnesium transporter
MLVDCAHYVRGVRQDQGPTTLEQAAACPRRGASFVWLELFEPGSELMAELRARFGLHELAIEDAARAHQRPKVEGYDDFYFIVFRTARDDPGGQRVQFGEVHVFLAPGYVIAVRHGNAGALTGARQRLQERPALLKSGPAAVVWGILDAVVDDFEPVVEAIENDIEAVEHMIFAGHGDAIERIHDLKQQVNNLYRAVHPLLVPLEAMEHGAFAEMDPAMLRYFRDVGDHLRHIHEEVLARREQLNNAFEANAALISVRQNEISARQNEIVKQLTIVATVFLPLSFVVGFFGQNFGWLVAHIDSLTTFTTLGIGGLALPCAALYVWFKRGGYTSRAAASGPGSLTEPAPTAGRPAST